MLGPGLLLIMQRMADEHVEPLHMVTVTDAAMPGASSDPSAVALPLSCCLLCYKHTACYVSYGLLLLVCVRGRLWLVTDLLLPPAAAAAIQQPV